MKLLLFLFLFPIGLKAQPVAKAKTIAVTGISFNEICTALLDSGYAIEKRDNELQTIRTEDKVYKRYFNAAYKINVRIKDSIAYFSATFTCPFDQWLSGKNAAPLFLNEPAQCVLTRNGEIREKSMTGYAFSEMNRFAISFGRPARYE